MIYTLATSTLASYQPVNMIEFEENEMSKIKKTYHLPIDTTPSEEILQPFFYSGLQYTFVEFLEEEAILDRKEVVETVEISTKTNKIEDILPLLEPSMFHITEDEFEGELTLDLTSIQVEIAGYGSGTKTLTETKTYPNLSSADMGSIPQTVTIGSLTYNYSSVNWQTANDIGIDGHNIPKRFTAVVTYQTSQRYSYVTGYKVTADYVGEVEKNTEGLIQYVAVFVGAEEIQENSEEIENFQETQEEIEVTEESGGFSWAYVVIPLLLFVFPPLCYFGVKFAKEKMYENRGDF